jgi:hypothetical protein
MEAKKSLGKCRATATAIPIALAILVFSCGGKGTKAVEPADNVNQTIPLPNSADPESKSNANSAPQDCSQFRAEKATGPENPSELISHINRLPRPVSLVCIITSLPRPLSLHLTSSELSVQPAMGKPSPRVLIRISDLILTIATSGPASRVLEFGFLVNARQSIKGEIALPVLNQLGDADPYLHVAQRNGAGEVIATSCRSCHLNESPAGAGWPKEAFVSDAFAPSQSLKVRVDSMPGFVKLCNENRSLSETDQERCQILQAIFAGEVTEAAFPGMKTMLESF